MKSLAIALLTLSTNALAAQPGVAECRAGYFAARNGTAYPENAKIACADVKSLKEGICRGGYLSASEVSHREPDSTSEAAKEACKDVRTVDEAVCRAGFFASSKPWIEVSVAKNACKDL